MELLNKLSTRKTNRWRYISAQKVSEELLEELTENRVALPAKYAWHPEYDQPIEVQPVLMVEEIVDFIVSRLARDVSFENDLFSLTFSGSSYLDHVYKSDQRRQERNSIFLSFAVPTLIPKNVGSLRIGDYLEIREMYSPLRKEIGSFAGQLVEANFLDDGLQQKKFLSRLDGAVRQVQSSLEQQEKLIAKSRIHNTTKLVLGVGGSIVGAGIGGILGNLYGAAAGSVLGHFLNGVTDKYSSAVHSDQDGFLRNTAMMHAAVEQRLNNSVPTNSNTWL
ncbi:hypothetical protein [Hasllibacter sp. MH4015]|uniref:hypothetical protein n=1 Tax=Hasllibacter sp. MH4015 TaxID=2854029 RepID=UPI001CD36910|nr:hypothetical protein [Hasllibacter sp. MH4015]